MSHFEEKLLICRLTPRIEVIWSNEMGMQFDETIFEPNIQAIFSAELREWFVIPDWRKSGGRDCQF